MSVNECLSPKPNCSVGQPSCRFIIVFRLYLAVLLPVISNGSSWSPSLWGRFLSVYWWDEFGMRRFLGIGASPLLGLPHPAAQVPWCLHHLGLPPFLAQTLLQAQLSLIDTRDSGEGSMGISSHFPLPLSRLGKLSILSPSEHPSLPNPSTIF